MRSIRMLFAGLALAALGVALAAGCTSRGTGTGVLAAGPATKAEAVTFSWKVKGASAQGEMKATLADGRRFSGPFVQMTHERLFELDPLWDGWPFGWDDWNWDGRGTGTVFETTYDGKVVANLKGPGNDRMRCRFTLNQASSGMEGGGQGQCQLAGGGTIDAVFPRS